MVEGDYVGNGSSLIIVGTSDGDVVAFDGCGEERWRRRLGSSVSSWPVFDDIPGIGPSILVASEEGIAACLSPDGKIRWKADLEGSLTSFNSMGVVRGANRVAVVATDRKGRVTGISAKGQVVWRFHTHHEGVGPAAIGDLDSDGRDEILFCAGDGHLYCLEADGFPRWSVRFLDSAEYSAPVLADLGAGRCVVAGAADDLLRCVSPDGRVVWTQRGVGAGSIEIDLSLADIDGDGIDEVVYCHAGRAIQAVDGKGDLLWQSFHGGGDQPFGPSIGDIDGDGNPEILLTQRDGPKLRILDQDGALIEEYEVPGGMVGSPVIADVDDDGKLEVMVVEHRTGKLACYETQAPASPEAVPWPTSRGGFDGRASHLRTPANPVPHPMAESGDALIQPRWPAGLRLGTNDIEFTSQKRFDGENYPVHVLVRGPDGIDHHAVLHTRSEATRLEFFVPGEYQLKASLVEGSTGKVLGEYEGTFEIRVFEDELEEAQKSLTNLEQLEAETKGIGRLTHSLRIAWRDLEERIESYESLPKNERRKMIAEVRRTLGVLRRHVVCNRLRATVLQHTDRPVEFIPWLTSHPWAEFKPEEDAPLELLEELVIHTDGDGHDAMVVQLANLRIDSLDVRAWVDPLVGEDGENYEAGDHLTLRQVTWVPTSTGAMGADALPEIGNAGLLHLPPSSGSRLWIDIDTGDLPPGTYTSTLHLRALIPTEATWDIPVRWTVAPVALPDVMPVRFCNWGYVLRSPLKHAPGEAIRDMQDHHTNVFVLSGELLPKITYDSSGHLVGEIDWQKHNWILDNLRAQDMFLVAGSPVVPAEGAPGHGSAEWERAFEAFLPQWIEYLEDRGVGYDRWAFYPVDEPGLLGGALIDRLDRYARFYKSIDPKIRIYTDPFKGMTVADLKRVLDLVDIFQPNFGAIVNEPSRERIDFLRKTGKTLWTYEAHGMVKDMVGIKYYWQQIWTAWELGLTGVGFWSYCTRPYDLWQGPNPNNNDWEMVYQGRERPVPSVRWQAIRIGIEDYARMWRLRETIETARKAGFKDEANRSAGRLGKITGEARESSWDPALVANLRRELIETTMSLLRLVDKP